MYQGYGSSLPPPQQQHHQQVQSPAYGQQPQWSPAAEQAHYGHAAAPPLPDVYADPNAFAQMYKSHLAALTFNSKPIITNLTVMAHENVSRMANVIAQCLDEHILQVRPGQHVDTRINNVLTISFFFDLIVPPILPSARYVRS